MLFVCCCVSGSYGVVGVGEWLYISVTLKQGSRGIKFKEMKTFYYSIGTHENTWSEERQYKTQSDTWEHFAKFCSLLAKSMNTTVRACTTEGYNNQGYYFN